MGHNLSSVTYAIISLAGPNRVAYVRNAQARMLTNVVLTIREMNRL